MPFRRERLLNFRGLLLAALGFIGLAVVAMGYSVWKLRSDAIEDAYKHTGELATVLADQFGQTFREFDVALGDIQDRIQQLDVGDSARLDQVMSTQFGYRLLKNRLDRLPQADVIAVADGDGRVAATSRAWPAGRLDVSNRDYFQFFKYSAERGTYVGIPQSNRVTGTPTVFVVRPIRDQHDGLIGIVGIGVRIATLSSIYGGVGLLGDHGFVLARTEGTILVRYPDQQRVPADGRVPTASRWYDVVAKGGGSFASAGGMGPGTRLVSVRLVPGYPLVVNVGLGESTALGVWRQRTAFIVVGTLLATICSIFLLWAVSNRISLLKQSEASLAEQTGNLDAKSRELELAKAQIDAAVHNMRQGISMFDGEQRLVLCNARYLELYGMSPDVVKPGCKFIDILKHRKSLGNYTQDPLQQGQAFAARAMAGHIYIHHAELPDGRIIAVSANPVVGGGWVATHEDITERHRAEAIIAHMARHDALTGLPNRAVFEEKLNEALARLKRGGEPFALILFDIDRFKNVNDTFGHPAGDAVLKAVAERVRLSIREVDCAARLGGDEFGILLAPSAAPAQGARTLANRLLDAMVQTVTMGGCDMHTAVSIGIAIAPQDGDTLDDLFKHADRALYRAKAEGRNRLRFFDRAVDVDGKRDLDLRWVG